ncbi:MAG: SDR family oxidoreductase [Spirochaetes bacterium]|nr:SDR family oxidoreductase [Spirochaetota bacterium]
MKTFKDKTVYIIGGSSGIGLSVARLLVREQAVVVIFARRQRVLDYAVELIKKTAGNANNISAMRLDATDYAQVSMVMREALDKFGAPDLLVNCAGRALPDYFENISCDQFNETMKVNFSGVWHVIKELVPAMKRNGGHIVNVSSVGGYIGLFGYTDYCASKFAVIGFSEALRSELKFFNIGISVICPPDTDTPGFANENIFKPEETKMISGNIKPVSPEFVARKLLRGVKKKKFLILPGFSVVLSNRLKGILPGLMDFILNRSLAGVAKVKKI